MIKDVGEEEGLDGWVQEKIIKANDYLNTIREYLEGKQVQGVDEADMSRRGFLKGLGAAALGAVAGNALAGTSDPGYVKKVQEKVGTIVHNNDNSFSFNLTKYSCRVNGKCTHKCYEEGDNDFYWLNCKNGKFYVIPEDALLINGHIGKECKKEKLYVSPTNENTEWCNEYLFDYNNVDKERLLKLINQ